MDRVLRAAPAAVIAPLRQPMLMRTPPLQKVCWDLDELGVVTCPPSSTIQAESLGQPMLPLNWREMCVVDLHQFVAWFWRAGELWLAMETG